MAQPPPCPPPQWVMLRRFPRADTPEDAGSSLAETPKDAGTGRFLALAAPPMITQLNGSPSLVLAADPSGILLLSDSSPLAGDNPASTSSYILWDSVSHQSYRITASEAQIRAAGLIVVTRYFGDCDIVVAELLPPSAYSDSALLRCFYVPEQTGEWVSKSLRFPPMKFPWRSEHVLCYKGKLWWVDLLQGLLSCNPFAERPELQFVQLPSGFLLTTGNEQRCRQGLINDRCINLSGGKLRLVVITRNTPEPAIKLWTLNDLHAGKWTLEYNVCLWEIYTDESYKATGLPMKRPVLVNIHPGNPRVVYFFLKGYIFGVDLQLAKVTDSTFARGDEASNNLLVWELPQSLWTTSSGPSPSPGEDSAFNGIVDSFCNAYSRELVNNNAHLLAELAIGFYNRKMKKEESKFKLLEHLSLCCFYEGDLAERKKYAHMNFYAQTDSAKVLVFAELHTEAIGDDDWDNWDVSLFTVLSRDYHGGLAGNMATKKRKKHIYCIACEPEVLHPISGFQGGYCGAA